MTRSDRKLGPPNILRNEVVRVVRASGNEVNELTDEMIPPGDLIGIVGTVHGAVPVSDGTGWLLSFEADDPNIALFDPIPETRLESIGQMCVERDGHLKRVLLDRAAGLPWYDDVLITLDFDAIPEDQAASLERNAIGWIESVASDVSVQTDRWSYNDGSWNLSIFVDSSNGDAQDAFDAIMRDAIRTTRWINDDSAAYLCSEWERDDAPDGDVVVSPAVCQGSVMYRRYEGTDRRERRCPPWPSEQPN